MAQVAGSAGTLAANDADWQATAGVAAGQAERAKGPEPEAAEALAVEDPMRLRQWLGLALSLVVGIVILAAQASSAMPPDQHRMLGVLLIVAILWVTELFPVAITGLLVGPLIVMFRLGSVADVLSGYFGNLTLLLFGVDFLGIAMGRFGLDRRFARFVTSQRLVQGHLNAPGWWGELGRGARVRAAVMFSGWAMSMWISNTGSTRILVPIVMKAMGTLAHQRLPDPMQQRAVTGTLLATAYACSAGGMGTLVGTAPNIVASDALSEEGIDVDFLKWLAFGVPTSFVVVLWIYLVTFFTHPPARSRVEADASPPGPWSFGEKATTACFGLTVLLWVFPSVYSQTGGPGAAELKAVLKSGVAVVLGTAPLFIVVEPRSGGRRLLPWAVAKQADWGIIMLIGGGLVLGKNLTSTGLGARLGTGFVDATGVSDMGLLLGLFVFFTIFATEVCSNTATTNLLVPIALSIAKTIAPDPAPGVAASAVAAPVVGVALAASCAFMMPVATPPNYIAADTGHVDLGTMVKVGLFINVGCVGIVWLMTYLIVLLGGVTSS